MVHSFFLILLFASDLQLNISPCSVAECHVSIQSEKVSKGLLSRICQQSSVLGHWPPEPASFPSRLAAFSILCSRLLPASSPFRLPALCQASVPHLFCMAPQTLLVNSSVVWPFLSTLKWISGMLPVQRNHTFLRTVWPALCILLSCEVCLGKVLERWWPWWNSCGTSRWLVQVALPLTSDSQKSNHMAPPVSLLAWWWLQKHICLQLGLFWEHHQHQNGYGDHMLGDFHTAFCAKRLSTPNTSYIPTSTAWFMPQYYVPWNIFHFTFQ